MNVPDKITLNNTVLNNIDTNSEYYRSHINENYFHFVSGKEHYRLLIYLSKFFNNTTIIDLGIHRGASSLSLSTNQTNIVHSFDVKPTVPDILNNLGFSRIKNMKYYIENILDSDKYHSLILNTPFIFLDTNHDGIFESSFYNFLVDNHYQGILGMDDIFHTDYPDLISMWNKITTKKVDITKYGHWSGTGLVLFNDTTSIIQE